MKPAACLAATLSLAFVLGGCEREQRDFSPPKGVQAAEAPRMGSLRPGAGDPLQSGHRPERPGPAHEFEANAYLVTNGKRLFRWYNCNGCHGQGGGGFGPALMDGAWLYGSEPADIFASIVEGRPNGMPAFGGRVPEDQVWQLVAYVRSMSGQLRKDAAPSRADGLAGAPPENTRAQEKPYPAAPERAGPASAPASAASVVAASSGVTR